MKINTKLNCLLSQYIKKLFLLIITYKISCCKFYFIIVLFFFYIKTQLYVYLIQYV